MTTVVYQRATRTLATDTQVTDDGVIFRAAKHKQIRKGVWVAWAGDLESIAACVAWIEAGMDDDGKPDFSSMDPFTVLIIDQKGARIRHVDNSGFVWEIEDDVIVEGTGGAYAYGALCAGAELQQALEIAASKDIYTSAPFNLIRIE